MDSFSYAVISGVMIAYPTALNFSSLRLSVLASPWRHDFEDSFRLRGSALSLMVRMCGLHNVVHIFLDALVISHDFIIFELYKWPIRIGGCLRHISSQLIELGRACTHPVTTT
jgi:hypothetical protein